MQELIEMLLNRINTRNQFVGGTFAALGGTTGNIQMLQRDANAAITLWRERHDSSGLQQLVTTLHAYGALTDTEYEHARDVLDGEE